MYFTISFQNAPVMQTKQHYLYPIGDGTGSQKSNDSPKSHGQKMAGGHI